MLTRLHITSFIGLSVTIWLIALWTQGLPPLSIEFFKPFSIVVGAMTSLVALFNKYLWSWKIFRGWYVNRPDLRGTWKVELKSNWIDPETNKVTPPINGYVIMRQSLTTLSVRLMTKESRSKSIAHSLEKEDDGLFRLAAIYRNEPKIEFQGIRSEIHHGSFLLEVHGSPVTMLDGHYWTDRNTNGSIKLTDNIEELCNTFEQAEKFYNDPNKQSIRLHENV